MSFYTLLYIFVILFLFFIGLKANKQYKKYIHQKYFIFSIYLINIWLIIYLISFTLTYNKEILLYFSRFLYSTALLYIYSMLFFVYFFGKIKRFYIHKIIIIIGIILFLIGFNTPYLIETMEYNQGKQIFIEKYGILYNIYAILYFLSLPAFIIISYLKIKKVNKINKIRLKYISIGFIIFISLEVIFLSILPLFNIRILQKEQILFFIPYIIGIWYSLNKYHFVDLKIQTGKIITYILSILLSLSSTFIIYKFLYLYYKSYKGNLNLLFGKQNEFLSEYDLFLYIIISIILFIMFHNIINKIFKYDTKLQVLIKKINRLKKEIPFITNIYELNNYLLTEFKKIFNIKYIEIKLIDQKNNEIYKYFSTNKLNKIFINDIVFIEENKNKFDYNKIKKEINKNTYLIFPIINNKSKLVGTFNIGIKYFKDTYTSEEINIIQDLVYFLEGHIKYLGIYDNINNLNFNLDKLVDKKTIEYNNLINKQKEFIGYISHEVKTPIANSIFQADCIINNIKYGDYTNKSLIKDIDILNSQLLKSGNLLNKLFDIEKYEINKYELYKENTNLNKLLENEVNIFKKVNKNISFKTNIDKLIFIHLDVIQFTQVIDNILTNAIKFCNSKNAKIIITNYTKGEKIYIIIEDNGIGFNKTDIKNIFDKYSTGKSSFSGLGMGLYLCKKIVELHKGKISAEKSQVLGGAKFTIKLPK